MKRVAILSVLFMLVCGLARADAEITLERPELYGLQAAGFELQREAVVDIDAVGRQSREQDSWVERWWSGEDRALSVFAWLIDADTRRPVWIMEAGETTRHSGDLRRAEESLRLEPGRYEMYLFSGHGWLARRERQPRDDDDRGSFWERVFSGRKENLDDLQADLEDCYLTISVPDVSVPELRRYDVTGDRAGALLRLNRSGDTTLRVGGLELDQPTDLRVYTLFEQQKNSDTPADYGWIVDASTREVVWDPDSVRSRGAGGGEKNQFIDTEVHLPAGRYLVYYGTDDSHSFQEFNTAPPYDPYNWGFTLFPGEQFQADAVRVFDPDPLPAPLVDLTRVGNHELRQQPFRMDRAGKLHVYAAGEYSDRDDSFVDYAWIIEASSGKTAWEMTERNTTGAGGDEKNRMFDGLVELADGDYILYYTSDDSHATDDWNVAMPFDPAAWGVRIRPAPGSTPAGFRTIEEDDVAEGDLLARLVHAGSRARLRHQFTVDVPTRIRIYAVGEGRSGEMYDYGYVVDEDTGRRIWEMEYDRTRHAGGADKNRVVEHELSLEPGSYEVVYVTDGTHAFGEWNARPPRDPMSWGITVRRVEP